MNKAGCSLAMLRLVCSAHNTNAETNDISWMLAMFVHVFLVFLLLRIELLACQARDCCKTCRQVLHADQNQAVFGLMPELADLGMS